MFNVRLYGAVGNGVESDLDAFNRVISELNAAGGGTIYAPAGNYVLGALSSITVPFGIRGDGMGVTTFRFTDTPGIQSIGPQNVISDLLMVSDGSGAPETAIYVSDGSGGSKCDLQRIRFEGSWGCAVNLLGLDEGILDDLVVRGTPDMGDAIALSGCDKVMTQGSIITGANRGVVQEDSCTKCDVVDNFFESIGTWAVYLSDGTGATTDARVFNHYVDCPDPAVFGDSIVNEIGYFVASTTKLGMVKIGDGINVNSEGEISVSDGSGGTSAFSGVRVQKNANQTIASQTFTTLTWATEVYDVGGYFNSGSSTSRLTAPVDGFYKITLGVLWAANTNGYRLMYIVQNSLTAICQLSQRPTDAGSNETVGTVTTDYYLTAGQYVEARVYQHHTADIDVEDVDSTFFCMTLMGE